MNIWMEGKLNTSTIDEKEFFESVKMYGISNIKFVALSPRAFGNHQEEHFIFSRALARFQELVKL